MSQKLGTIAVALDVLLAVGVSFALLFFVSTPPAVSPLTTYSVPFPQTTLVSVATPGATKPDFETTLSSFATQDANNTITVVGSFTVTTPTQSGTQKSAHSATLLDCTLLLDSTLMQSTHEGWNTAPENQSFVLAGSDIFHHGLHQLILACHVYTTALPGLLLTSQGIVVLVDAP